MKNWLIFVLAFRILYKVYQTYFSHCSACDWEKERTAGKGNFGVVYSSYTHTYIFTICITYTYIWCSRNAKPCRLTMLCQSCVLLSWSDPASRATKWPICYKRWSSFIYYLIDWLYIWSEWWDNMTWPKKDKDKYIERTPSKSDLLYLWRLRHLLRVMRKHDLTKRQRQRHQAVIYLKTAHAMTITRRRQKQIQRHLENTFKELSKILVTFVILLHFWPMRTSKHYDRSDMTIESYTGVHFEFNWVFLGCFWVSQE